VLSFSIDVSSPFLTPRVERDPIASIAANYGGDEVGLPFVIGKKGEVNLAPTPALELK
jgi:hypothetical protein